MSCRVLSRLFVIFLSCAVVIGRARCQACFCRGRDKDFSTSFDDKASYPSKILSHAVYIPICTMLVSSGSRLEGRSRGTIWTPPLRFRGRYQTGNNALAWLPKSVTFSPTENSSHHCPILSPLLFDIVSYPQATFVSRQLLHKRLPLNATKNHACYTGIATTSQARVPDEKRSSRIDCGKVLDLDEND